MAPEQRMDGFDRRQQLPKSMEHIRYAITVEPLRGKKSGNDETHESIEAVGDASIRSHSASHDQKRSDPFMFGSRYLEEGDDVYEFNAWDHVEVDDSYRDFAEEQYARQRDAPVSDFDRYRFNAEPAKWWNRFYANNSTNFFKNRNWLFQEFPVLRSLIAADAGRASILEVGAGAGNSAFPILAANENPNLEIHACDFSRKAVELIRLNPAYDGRSIRAEVWDVASAGPSGTPSLPCGVEPGSVDVVLMVFIFSALAPEQWPQAVRNLWAALRPGGVVLFRDYGRGDLAQVRFKKGRWMGENFYVRGDGTRVYFFEREELARIWSGAAADGENKSGKDPDEVKGTEDREQSGRDPAGSRGIDRSTVALLARDTQPNLTASASSSADAAHLPAPDERGRGTVVAALEHATSSDDADNAAVADSSVVEDAPARPQAAFEILDLGVDRRMLVNRQRRLKMYRCWIQARFLKPLEGSC